MNNFLASDPHLPLALHKGDKKGLDRHIDSPPIGQDALFEGAPSKSLNSWGSHSKPR